MSTEELQNKAAEEEVPTLEAAEVPQSGKQSKRYAKAMAKMGLKPEANINKVHIRKEGSLSFAINQPEVYRFPGTNTFVIFGETQLEDMGALSQEAAARAAVSAATASEKVEEISAENKEDEEDNDQGNLDDKEIEVVMTQANVSRGRAIKVLKRNKGDVVNAIMDLTM